MLRLMLLALALPAPGDAASPPTTLPADRVPESLSAAEQPAAAPLPGPRYLDLRYDEDFSYLAGPPDSYRHDLFDPIKHVRLGDEWTLTLGGEFRVRLEAETNKNLDVGTPTQDTFVLHRTFLHLDLRYRNLLRLFAQGINAQAEDRDGPLLPGMENRFDVHQLFLDLTLYDHQPRVVLRFGRQELRYGRERLVSPFDWGNTRRRFDGVKVMLRAPTYDWDLWYVRPIPNDLTLARHRKPDKYDEDAHFYGSWFTWHGWPDHGLGLYFLALRNTADLTNANGRTGDLSLYTLGGRFWGRRGNWDYDTELAGQWGSFAGDRIQAWAWAAEAGHTFSALPARPRLGVGFDLATGDDDRTDEVHQTFNQLFPLGHAWLGYIDLVGRQNIVAANVNLSATPAERITCRAAWFAFWAFHSDDALYNPGSVPLRRAGRRDPQNFIGNELDLTIAITLDVHSSILIGYSRFWHGDFIRQTGPGSDADLFYVQYQFRF